jgi:predicted ester cyclase
MSCSDERRPCAPFRQFFQAWQTAFPDSRVEARRIVVDGDRAMTESTFSGTHSGVFRTSAGQEIPPTGKVVAVDYCDAWKVVDGKATYDRVYFDELELLGQLGLLP